MKFNRYHIGILLAVLTTWTACGNEDDLERSTEPVKVSLAFSLSSKVSDQTRATDPVIQEGSFRGIDRLYIIPFDVQGTITAEAKPKLFSPTGSADVFDRTSSSTPSRYYYYENCSFMQGVASFLVYGHAEPTTGGKDVNGSLTADFPADMSPSDITFSLESIYSETTPHATASAIAKYLTNIANTTGWSTTTDSRLKAYYQNFIGQGSEAPSVIAGSSASVQAYVNHLKTLVTEEPESTLRTAILNSITAGSVPADYPASIGLPDGAAALRWEIPDGGTAYAFVPQTVTTTEANINSIMRFAYPPELYYYGNSQICASNIDNRKTYYERTQWGTSNTDENTVLAGYEYDPGIVSNNTKAVAIKNPVQYAVARMDATIKADAASLTDAKNTSISIEATTFPLTAVIVGGQRPVGFDFKPKDNSETDVRFVYDSKVNTNTGSTPYYLSSEQKGPVHTLLLQNYDGEAVTIILEFQNNSNTDFYGVDGIIYSGTKFYLIGSIPAPTADSEDYTKRVFTQDYTTTVNMKVESLAKAYNVMPNLLSPRLEIGVTLTTKWEQAIPTTVILN